MGKGKRSAAAIVISSSDNDEEGDLLLKSNLRNSKLKSNSKSKSASVPRTNPKRAKKAPLSSSLPRHSKNHSGFDEIKRFCEEFDMGFNEFKVSTGHDSSTDLWVDKYKPCSLEEVAVHKKKVEEVKAWFEERLITRMDSSFNNVLLIAGPAGVGKSATVHAIASHLGATICEWNTPTPTIWKEHLHHSNSGLRYMSKLEEFESFAERTRKYGLISSSVTGRPPAPVILLIDDLPVVNGKVAYERLNRCLMLLVQSVRIPTAILFTDYGKVDSADFNMRCPEELLQSLEYAGACKVTFNPITVNSMKKVLAKICRMEQVEVSADSIEAIAKASGGDMRNAITSLQYFCLNPHPMPSLPSSRCYSETSKGSSDDVSTSDDRISLTFGRDETLSLFHALGKFLHNKRESEDTGASDRGIFVLKKKFMRLPLKMEAPEVVLSQAHGQARPITDFLHENVLDFLSEEATDDAWVVSSYLSDADILLASPNEARSFETQNLLQLAAASVATRGVLFGNSHPSPSRWHAIRRPKLWQIEQSLWHNKGQMLSQRGYYCNSQDNEYMSTQLVIATELKPVLKWLGHRAYGYFEAEQSFEDTIGNDSNSLSLDDRSEDISDDEIEDW
nr:cell cycle checkpoint protein RAD17 isoform X1 [Ipomoea batatas]